MGRDTAITLSSTNLADIADRLKGRGIVELSPTQKEVSSGQKALFIRPGGVLQMLRAWFSGKSERNKQADRVCDRLGAVLDKVPGKERLLQNVRAQIMKEGRLTGEFLALNLKALHEGGVLKPKGLAPFALPTQGQQVRILSGRPAEVVSDRCIVGYGTARELLGAETPAHLRSEPKELWQLEIWSVGAHANGSEPVHEFSAIASRATTLASCPPFNETSKEDRTPQEMYDLIHAAIGKTTGTIVIEPQPDSFQAGQPVCTDKGLTGQISAALERKAEAQHQGVDRVIAFVSPDTALLKRIADLHADLTRDQDDTVSVSRTRVSGSGIDSDGE